MSTKEKNSITILWRIKNFSEWDPDYHVNPIYSAQFTSRVLEGWRCQLSLLPPDIGNHNRRICLYLYSEKNPDFPVDCEFAFIGSDGSPLVAQTVRNRILQRRRAICMPNYPMHEEVFLTNERSFLPNGTLSVRCRIWKSDSNFPNTEFCSVQSRIEVVRDCFLWPIKGLCKMKLKESVAMPVPLHLIHGSFDFNLICSLIGDSIQNSELNFEVEANKIHKALLVKLKVSALSNKKEIIMIEEHKHLFPVSEKKQTWILPKFLSRNDLTKKNSPFTCDDVLNLFCHFTAVSKNISDFVVTQFVGHLRLEQEMPGIVPTFSGTSCSTLRNNIPVEQSSHSVDALLDDFRFLYQDQTLSDFELRCGDVTFPVHKSILSARSPVFRAMFTNNMKESASKSLQVPDVDVHSLNRMLTFLYKGNVEPGLRPEGATKLYYAADKYQIPSLKRLCSSILRLSLSVSNVSDILTLADRHQDQELTAMVFDFILNRFDDVMESEEWEKFLDTDPSFAGKTTHHLVKERKKRGMKIK